MFASPDSTSKWSRAISCAAIMLSGLGCLRLQNPPLLSLYKKKLSASSAALAQVFIPSAQLPENNVRLACVKHIASLPSEPGSNSSFEYEKIRVPFYLVESTEWSSLSVTPEQKISSRRWSALSK